MTFTPGSIKVDLTDGCWGHVNVCVGGKCGGVRRDTWSEEKSDTLCGNLGCGTTIATADNPDGKSQVIVESLHTKFLTDNLNKSVLVLSKINPNEKPNHRSAFVVCSGNMFMCTGSEFFLIFFIFFFLFRTKVKGQK